MTRTHRAVADRVARLAASLADLKRRVRAAVATETGKAVAEAVRDVLTAVLAGPPPGGPYRPSPRPVRPAWDRDDVDDEHDPGDDDRDRGDDSPDDPDDEPRRPAPRSAGPHPRPCRWPVAATIATDAARGWAMRRLPAWAAAAVAVLAAVAAAVGGPVADAGLALASAAADLLPHAAP